MIGLRHDYGWSEGVLSFWATGILTVLAVTSLALRYVTNPISCWLPAHFQASQVNYALQFCFQSRDIVSPIQVPGPRDVDEVVSERFTYHQWFPFFLGMAATLCLLPHLTWTMLSGFLWLDGHGLVDTVILNQRNAASRHVMLRDCALLLQAGLKGGKSVVAVATLGRKALGCGVCLIEMLLMLLVFAPQLGRGTEGGLVEEGEVVNTNDSLPLPADSFICSIPIRQMARVEKFDVTCILPLGQVYTKGLVFLVYLFLVLFLLCALDLTVSIMRLAMPRLKDVALTRFLAAIPSPDPSGSQTDRSLTAHQSRFLESLGLDGRWVLAVVADRCGAVAAADLTNHLLQVFKDSPRPSPPMTAPADSSGAAPGSPGTEETGGDTGAIPMITIGEKDGSTTAQDDEKGKMC